MKPLRNKICAVLVTLLISPVFGSAQCAMCRAALKTSESQGAASGINHGITYLMIFPYLIAAVLGYVVYRLMRSKRASE